MTRVLYRLSRSACPVAERPWLDALFAEMDAIESGRSRLLWQLGAFGLVTKHYLHLLSLVITPAWLTCLAVALAFTWLGFIEYEGLAVEDDWYPALATGAFATLFVVSIFNLKRRSQDTWP